METKRAENKSSDDWANSDKKSSGSADSKQYLSEKKLSKISSEDEDRLVNLDTKSENKLTTETKKLDPMKLSGRGGAAAFTRKTNEQKFLTGGGGGGGGGGGAGPSSPTDSMLSPCTKKLRRKQSKKLSSSSSSVDGNNATSNSNLHIALEFWVPPEDVNLILGSSSASRAQVLVDAGWNFQVMKPNIDERLITSEDPFRLPILIAKEKALAILNQLQPLFQSSSTASTTNTGYTTPTHSSYGEHHVISLPSSSSSSSSSSSVVILTCDQIVLYRNEIRHKPSNRSQAREYLLSYQQNEIVQTISAVVATHYPSGKQASEIDIATIYWNGIPDEVIEGKLLDKEEIYSSCGAFLIEDPDFLAYVNRIEGDLDSIRGMPMKATKKVFRTVISTDI
jgi:predicted house-cleaning NTP pyrophosphatase (Maf/HAM1 superfamily)